MKAPTKPKNLGETLQLLYRQLYSEADLEEMRDVWAVLVRDFFQHRIKDDATVVEVGAGPCLFINAVRAARRIAIDLNPDTLQRAAAGVEVLCSLDASLADLPDASVDHIFMSNFLEHLPSYLEVVEMLGTAFEKLRPGGSLLILQPNYRLEPVRYFDTIDHTVVLTDRSLVLVLKALSYSIDELRVRFLPYTSKSRIPKSPWLVAAYLRLRPLQWIMGGQTFINARRPRTLHPEVRA
jgi:SAM-dependent methyltransferase